MNEPLRYWGLYCPQHNVWLHYPNGSLVFYPSPMIVEAELSSAAKGSWPGHAWEVTEYGQQSPVDRHALSSDAVVCPIPY